MDENIRQALLEMFSIRDTVKLEQQKRGHTDMGERSSVTSGKHLDPLAKAIAAELVDAGIKKDELCIGDSGMELPGWYRPTKKWDILAFQNANLVEAIELKSIAGSYGNNFNNRTEEALGSALDAKTALEYKLFKNVMPPAFGYVMVVKDEIGSRKPCGEPNEPHFEVDPIFHDTSYADRFQIMCERLLQKKIYDAVWLVLVNPETKTITEPRAALSYEKFMIRMKTQINLFK